MAQNVNPRVESSSSESPKRSENMNDRIESNKVVQRYVPATHLFYVVIPTYLRIIYPTKHI